MTTTVVSGETFTSYYVKLQNDLVYLKRHHNWKNTSVQTDISGKQWWLFFGCFKNDEVKVYSNKEWLGSHENCAILLPPFSQIRWLLQPSIIEWEAYISSSDLPPELCDGPYILPWNEPQRIHSSSELIQKIKSQSLNSIKYNISPSAVSEKTKKFIDLYFQEDIPIHEIASRLKLNHRVMSRYFKNDFGLTPSSYRNKLRVMNSKCRMLFKNTSVIDEAISSGFSSPGGFNKAFRKEFALAPSFFNKLPFDN
ncbi:MAG: AraC family transcriptional regulator [Bdellovibrionales bacterium]|nr:AraC family transcriptional regulator [Bdellovibrionales bacterium]